MSPVDIDALRLELRNARVIAVRPTLRAKPAPAPTATDLAETERLDAALSLVLAETGKPGTNFKQVTPEARHKLAGIIRHYRGMAHPFATCVRDNTQRFGQERAERICAVVKDLAMGTTHWRKGAKAHLSEDAAQPPELDEETADLLVALSPEQVNAIKALVEAAPDA